MLVIASPQGSSPQLRWNIPINRSPFNHSPFNFGQECSGDFAGMYVIGEDVENIFLFCPSTGVLVEIGKISKDYQHLLAECKEIPVLRGVVDDTPDQ